MSATTDADRPDAPDFIWSNVPEPHRARSLQILRAHPSVRELFGRNPLTAVVCLGVVVVQMGIAYAMRDAAGWLTLPVAWGIGVFLSHATFCLYHECARQLFRMLWSNQLLVARNARPNRTRAPMPRPLYAPGTFDENVAGAI